MTYGAFTSRDFAEFEPTVRVRRSMPPSVLCAVALTLGSSLGLCALYGHPDSDSTNVRVPVASVPVASAPSREPRVALSPAIPPLRRDAWLYDPALISGQGVVKFAQSVALRAGVEGLRQRTDAEVAAAASLPSAAPPSAEPQSAEPQTAALETAEPAIVPALPDVPELVRNVPLPPPRPALVFAEKEDVRSPSAGTVRIPHEPIQPGVPSAEPDGRSILQKLFGTNQGGGSALAYAPPDGGLGSILTGPSTSYDRYTAVYDIAAHTVYLPNGTRLEAHSGLGNRLDDPRSVAERMRGATPPNVYELQLREQLFHGVRALRLNPVGNGTTYGRAGLLAHTFMLGPRGDSNGCVVFRDYRTFLQAYDSGQVKRLAVVARLN